MDFKCKILSLREDVKVIEAADIKIFSLRHLGENSGISKNQVHNILKSIEEIEKLWTANSNKNSKTVRFRKPNHVKLINRFKLV